MRWITLPGAPFKISVLTVGTGPFGTAIARDEAFAILDTFAEAGGNFADSAHVYADWIPGGAGASERTLGDWVRSRGLAGKFLIGTKGGHPRLESMERSRLAPEDLAQDLRESLDRLGLDRIDLYWLHRDDPAIPAGEILDALNAHLAAGAIRAIGCSNWSVERQQEADAYTAAHSLTSFCASQIGWSLARVNPPWQGLNGMRYMDEDTWRWHHASGRPVVAYTAQAQGFFSGKYQRGQAPPEGAPVGPMFFSDENFDRFERARELAARRRRRPNDIALAALLNQPFPVSAIVGPRTAEQMDSSLQAAELRLTPQEVDYLQTGTAVA